MDGFAISLNLLGVIMALVGIIVSINSATIQLKRIAEALSEEEDE